MDETEGTQQSTPQLSWTASEFVSHSKTGGWYALLIGGACALALVVWLITKDVISALVIVLAAGALAFFGSRDPREMSYALDEKGVQVGGKYFTYAQFKSFSVMREGAVSSILFMPLKRFALEVTIYYDPDHEEQIVQLINQHLPVEKRKHDLIDRLLWRARF